MPLRRNSDWTFGDMDSVTSRMGSFGLPSKESDPFDAGRIRPKNQACRRGGGFDSKGNGSKSQSFRQMGAHDAQTTFGFNRVIGTWLAIPSVVSATYS
jgi:hypothetical protein